MGGGGSSSRGVAAPAGPHPMEVERERMRHELEKAQLGQEGEMQRMKMEMIAAEERAAHQRELAEVKLQAFQESRDDLQRMQYENANAVRAQAEQQALMMREQFEMVTKTLESFKANPSQGVDEAVQLKKQIEELERERADWETAQRAREEELMKNSPPPFALLMEPPAKKPLFTDKYPCFAIMGKSGTGKSSLVNSLCGKDANSGGREVGSLTETTMDEPPPVFWTLPNRREVALFDRAGAGALVGSGVDYIKSQGLQWWTGIILVLDRNSIPEDGMIYSVAKQLGVPILVCRNKMAQDLEKEREKMESAGQVYSEEAAMTTIRGYLDKIRLDGNQCMLIDTNYQDRFQNKELYNWIVEHSSVRQ